MRPLISWADLAGRRVGVWGPAGVEGQANLRTLAALGVAPAVLVDDSPAGAGHGPAVLATADGGLEALASCDVVIKAPGISRYRDDARFLVDRGVAICGGLGLWLASQPSGQVIAITGTKGKSSTTAIAGHLLRSAGIILFAGQDVTEQQVDIRMVVLGVQSFEFSGALFGCIVLLLVVVSDSLEKVGQRISRRIHLQYLVGQLCGLIPLLLLHGDGSQPIRRVDVLRIGRDGFATWWIVGFG